MPKSKMLTIRYVSFDTGSQINTILKSVPKIKTQSRKATRSKPLFRKVKK